MREAIGQALAMAVSRAKAAGAAALVGEGDVVLFAGAHGFRQLRPTPEPATEDTVYDLASVTKAVATATSVLMLWQEGRIDLDAPVEAYLPVPGLAKFRLRHLLTHTSGLPAWKPLHAEATTATAAVHLIAQEAAAAQPGRRYRYSDLNFILLGRLVEMVAQQRLDLFVRERIFEPLGMDDTTFNPPASWLPRIAPTEECPWRGRLVHGQVHDENAYAFGGVSGHAGLFSTIHDLATFCRAMLSGKILNRETLDAAAKVGQVPFYAWQGLGWYLDPWGTRWTGYLPSRDAFGHPGFTGTSVWMDRATNRYAILLSNTVHPSRRDANNRVLRQVFHDGVAKALYRGRANVHTGLDRLMLEGFEPLAGKRIAVLTHHAAVDQCNRPLLDVLAFADDIDLRTIYSPEHGFTGSAEAGAHVGDSRRGSVPVVSLYGERKAPSPEELAPIDLFVVDLQDIGSRYYTYPATMKACIEACREAEVPVMVLDRPNPVGGARREGPLAESTDSPVCWGRVPVRHGLTLGETAVYLSEAGTGPRRINVMVYPADNWRREHWFDECALPWIPPSPNIPDLETALLYVGMCLFEGTNLNEGRGTDRPFKLVGAPWLDAQAALARIKKEDALGVRLEAARYTPRSLPGKAAHPRFQDQTCQGIALTITERNPLRPFLLAVALIAAIRETHPSEFTFKEDWFDLLAGTAELRAGIERGEKPGPWVRWLERKNAAFAEEAPQRYAHWAEVNAPDQTQMP